VAQKFHFAILRIEVTRASRGLCDSWATCFYSNAVSVHCQNSTSRSFFQSFWLKTHTHDAVARIDDDADAKMILMAPPPEN